MIKKILGAREYMRHDGAGNEWFSMSSFSIRKMYLTLIGEVQHVSWKKLICHNAALPKYIFISWLLMHRGLATFEYLQRIGVVADNTCCFCG